MCEGGVTAHSAGRTMQWHLNIYPLCVYLMTQNTAGLPLLTSPAISWKIVRNCWSSSLSSPAEAGAGWHTERRSREEEKEEGDNKTKKISMTSYDNGEMSPADTFRSDEITRLVVWCKRTLTTGWSASILFSISLDEDEQTAVTMVTTSSHMDHKPERHRNT